jgi:epoxyqueuosine reductase QueG
MREIRKNTREDHYLPNEILPEAASIIVYFIPFSNIVIASNTTGKYASEEWASAYIHTNALISAINMFLQRQLDVLGYRSSSMPATHNFDPKTLTSRWSHRHIAYIAGIGNFGLNRMLITESGCCGRLGSLVTDIPFEQEHVVREEMCLYRLDGSCGLCLRKCPIGALSTEGFARTACYGLCLENERHHRSIEKADVCGKCTVGLPCSIQNPVGIKRGKRT